MSSIHQANVEQTSSWLVQLTYSQLVEPAWSCKRGITHCVFRSTQPQQDGKSVLAKLTGYEVKAYCGWLGRCKPRAARVQMFVSATMDSRIVRCGIISSCQLTATSFRDWEVLLTHVSGAIASSTARWAYL